MPKGKSALNALNRGCISLTSYGPVQRGLCLRGKDLETLANELLYQLINEHLKLVGTKILYTLPTILGNQFTSSHNKQGWISSQSSQWSCHTVSTGLNYDNKLCLLSSTQLSSSGSEGVHCDFGWRVRTAIEVIKRKRRSPRKPYM